MKTFRFSESERFIYYFVSKENISKELVAFPVFSTVGKNEVVDPVSPKVGFVQLFLHIVHRIQLAPHRPINAIN